MGRYDIGKAAGYSRGMGFAFRKKAPTTEVGEGGSSSETRHAETTSKSANNVLGIQRRRKEPRKEKERTPKGTDAEGMR